MWIPTEHEKYGVGKLKTPPSPASVCRLEEDSITAECVPAFSPRRTARSPPPSVDASPRPPAAARRESGRVFVFLISISFRARDVK